MAAPGRSLVAAFALCGGLVPSAIAAAQAGAPWRVTCPFDTTRALLPVECGRLKVPENYARPGRDIDIAFMIVRARDNQDPQHPVLFLSGGPGAPSLVYAEMLLATPQVHEVVADRDWVFYDQRGSGRSLPALRCPRDPDHARRVRLCRDRFIQEGVDLSQYTSERSARDIEALRNALGVKQWNLWGISYGSRLAFAVARDFPASVRAIVHDGPSDPEAPEIIDDFRGTDAAIRRLLAKCAADAACALKYPGLGARFLATLPRIRQQPIEAEGQRIDDQRLVSYIRDYLFGGDPALLEARVQHLLAYMDAAARGDGPAMRQVEQGMPQDRDDGTPVPPEGWYAMGQNLSIECNEERAFESLEDYRRAAAASDIVRALFGPDQGAAILDECASWPSGRADPARKRPVHYDGPQLVFSGELDASLSGISGDRIRMRYPNARQVVFRNAGHGQVELADFPPAVVSEYRQCALWLARQFLADPNRRLDTGCAESRTLRLVP